MHTVHEVRHVSAEGVVGVPYCGIEIGGCNSPGEIEVSRHAVPKRQVPEPVAQHIADAGLQGGISRGKFSDDPHVFDVLLFKDIDDAGNLVMVRSGDLDSPVVDIAGNKMGVFADPEQCGGKTGTSREDHSDPAGLPLYDGIGRYRRAEDDSVD